MKKEFLPEFPEASVFRTHHVLFSNSMWRASKDISLTVQGFGLGTKRAVESATEEVKEHDCERQNSDEEANEWFHECIDGWGDEFIEPR